MERPVLAVVFSQKLGQQTLVFQLGVMDGQQSANLGRCVYGANEA